MRIVVGLGNFGDKYAYTFHNMGFLAAECLADRLGLKFDRRECDSQVAIGYIGGEKIVIAKPLTYMNLSGVAVKQLLCKYKAGEESLMVLFDDADIPKGSVRYRAKGSGGTHNGMRNIIATIGTENFARVRVGIGPVPERVPIADYVLSEVPRAERERIAGAIEEAAATAEKFLRGTLSPA